MPSAIRFRWPHEGTARLLRQGNRCSAGPLGTPSLSAGRPGQGDRPGVPAEKRLKQKKAVSGLITPAPPIFILLYNHTIVLSHDLSCVCMNPPSRSVRHPTGREAGCAVVAGIKESGHSRKVPDFKGFSACMLYHVIVSNRCTRFRLNASLNKLHE